MDHQPQFVREYLQQAGALIKTGAVREPSFSKGTYQFEVQEKGKKKAFPSSKSGMMAKSPILFVAVRFLNLGLVVPT